MNSAEYVDKLIADLKVNCKVLSDAAWEAGLACVGWAYVFGAWGEYCTVSYRKQAYARHGDKHPTIKSKCQAFTGKKSCEGCQWYPNGERTRCFDCRGFTYWIIKQIYGFELQGSGATSQWNTESNWKAKGTIDTCPDDVLVVLFKQDGKTMEHTGLGYHGSTLEASSGVQYTKKRAKKWTHWALPICSEGGVEPVPVPEGYAKVTGKKVALRKAPTTQASVIMRINTGEEVKLETPPPCEWDYVSYNGKTGWMMKEFLEEG